MEKIINSENASTNKNKTCLIILGPTGIGKTKISLAIGSQLNTEIINTDAFSFYKNAEIMTAKANNEEKQMVKHHLIDFLAINDLDFSVSNFQSHFDSAVFSIFAKEKIPVIVGGSNYYVDYILFDKRINILNINKSEMKTINNDIDYDGTYNNTDNKAIISPFVTKAKFRLIIGNLKNIIITKSLYNNLYEELQIAKNYISENEIKKSKKERLSYAQINYLTLEILNKIDNEYSKILDKYTEKIDNEAFLNCAEDVSKSENLLFEALNEILDYKNFINLIAREKDFSFLLHNLIETIDVNSFNLLHKNNLRKIVNILMYYFVYGIGKSQLLDRQLEILQANKEENNHIRFENSIIVYLKYVNYESYEKLLKSRIDKMLNEQNGLDEIFIILEFFIFLEKRKNKNSKAEINIYEYKALDFQKGILQAIGYKEFYEFYLSMKEIFLVFIKKYDIGFEYNNCKQEACINFETDYFQLFDINKITMSDLLEKNLHENNNEFFYQIIFFNFVYYFKKKYLYYESDCEENENTNALIK